MIPIFIVVGATAKVLNLRLRKRREALRAQQNLMGDGRGRSTHPDKLEVVE